jgi:hypothetical protein
VLYQTKEDKKPILYQTILQKWLRCRDILIKGKQLALAQRRLVELCRLVKTDYPLEIRFLNALRRLVERQDGVFSLRDLDKSLRFMLRGLKEELLENLERRGAITQTSYYNARRVKVTRWRVVDYSLMKTLSLEELWKVMEKFELALRPKIGRDSVIAGDGWIFVKESYAKKLRLIEVKIRLGQASAPTFNPEPAPALGGESELAMEA